jgi:sugar O-acyltransferase (sialic acid O-acetyltransferase NeuD family)
MTTRVIVIGGSDQGRQAIDIIDETGGAEVVGVLDRRAAAGEEVVGYPVLGSDDELAEAAASTRATAFVAAIGENYARHQVLTREMASCPDLEPYRVIHPSSVVARDARIGPGSIVMPGVVVGNGCRIGIGALVGTRSSLDHDCSLGDFASLGPGVTTGGHVCIGERSALGLGANVIHGITIGADTVVGAGALVVDDVADRLVTYGVPARVARTRQIDEPYLDRPPRRGSP